MGKQIASIKNPAMPRFSLREFLWLRHDEESPFIEDFSIDSDTMLISFGGGWVKPGGAPFALLSSISNFPVKKLYVRDSRFAWYHQGLPEIGEGIRDVALFLQKKIIEQNARRVVMAGGSIGGYAALLFGWLVEVDQVHAFNPLTIIRPAERFVKGDYFKGGWKVLKWRALMRGTFKSHKFSKQFSDLKAFFGIQNVKTEFHIHFAYNNRMDRRHATRMGLFPNVILHGYPEKQHSLKMLKKNGRLEKILLDACQVSTFENWTFEKAMFFNSVK